MVFQLPETFEDWLHAALTGWSGAQWQNAVVVSAANAVYIVDPWSPEQFTGFAALVEINGIAFDESGERMFVADNLRVHAFSKDLRLRWFSEPK